jgi:hypothetical protein
VCYGSTIALYDTRGDFFRDDAFIASLPDGAERAEYAALAHLVTRS